jgi:hypothetical protein
LAFGAAQDPSGQGITGAFSLITGAGATVAFTGTPDAVVINFTVNMNVSYTATASTSDKVNLEILIVRDPSPGTPINTVIETVSLPSGAGTSAVQKFISGQGIDFAAPAGSHNYSLSARFANASGTILAVTVVNYSITIEQKSI